MESFYLLCTVDCLVCGYSIKPITEMIIYEDLGFSEPGKASFFSLGTLLTISNLLSRRNCNGSSG